LAAEHRVVTSGRSGSGTVSGGTEIVKGTSLRWSDYNSVKHDLTKLEKATLKNLIYALSSAGLFVESVSVDKEMIRSIMKQGGYSMKCTYPP